MLKNRCKASLRQHSKAKALNPQRRWLIKAAERSLSEVRRRKPVTTFLRQNEPRRKSWSRAPLSLSKLLTAIRVDASWWSKKPALKSHK